MPSALLSGFVSALLLTLLIQLFHHRLSPGRTVRWLLRHPALLIAGALPLFALFALLLGIFGSVVPAISLTAAAAALLGYTDYLLLGYRNIPFVPRDLAMALNIGKLLSMISVASVIALAAGLAAVAAATVLLSRIFAPLGLNALHRAVPAVCGGVALVLCACAGKDRSPVRLLFVLLGADFETFIKNGNSNASYDRNGFLVAFFSQCMRPIMEKPADSGESAVQQVTRRYPPEIPSPARKPHILYIMSEAFSDPTVLPGLRFSEDPIPRVRELMRQYPSGRILSPGYGGGTAHCEFEALTGFSTGLTGGISAFENNTNRHSAFPSLPRRLLEQGYRTTALHPYKRGMYARTEAYPAIGLERFIDITGVTHTGTPDNSPYISDEEAYAELLELLEEGCAPQFIHLVTMQNHGDYSRKGRFRNTITVQGLPKEKDRNAMETYVQGLRYTATATARLLEQLSVWKEEVLVVFWGDHLPGVYPAGFLTGHEREKFETPFFIWANFALENHDYGTRSPMLLPSLACGLAKLPATPYDCFLADLQQQLHGVHFRFLVDAQDGLVLPEELDSRSRKLLEELKLLQYDTMLGGGFARRSGFFSSGAAGF